ncbi:hypothetical protein [Methanovulcanius yangii]|nr:hypothetical protein [Methanovulcanius yangii]
MDKRIWCPVILDPFLPVSSPVAGIVTSVRSDSGGSGSVRCRTGADSI